MRHLEFFAGIGGFGLAAAHYGWENVAHVEWNDFGAHVLKSNFKNAIHHGDITKVDFTAYRGLIDIITGGFPCQPYSTAGKRLGTEDERHLWPHMLRGIREVGPRWVVGENVRGLVNWSGGLIFEQVQADLEAAGYDVQSFILPACGVGAPHRRERVWIVAHANGLGGKQGTGASGQYAGESGSGSGGLSERHEVQRPAFADSIRGTTSDAVRTGGRQDHGAGKPGQSYQAVPHDHWRNFPTVSPLRDGNDGLPFGLVREQLRAAGDGHLTEKEIDQILGQAYGQWCKETIKAGGNAIVPQVAIEIFGAIHEYERMYGA